MTEQKCRKTSQILKDPKCLQDTSIEGNSIQSCFQSPLLLEKTPQTGAKALITIPLKFKFVLEACVLRSPASSLSNHVLDGVELIRMGMGFQ